MVLRRLERRGIGRCEVFADGRLPSVGVLVRRGKRRGVSVLLLPAQHALALGGERLGRGERRGIAVGHVLADGRLTGRGMVFRRLKRRGIAVLLLFAQHALAFGGEGLGRGERRGVARGHILANGCLPSVGVGPGRREGLFVALFAFCRFVVDLAVECLHVVLDFFERFLGRLGMCGQVVGYLLHLFLQFPPFGRTVFPVELVGKSIDPAHRDFVLGLMEEAVEEVRELLGRRVHSPAEPFAQQRTYSDCHSVIA